MLVKSASRFLLPAVRSAMQKRFGGVVSGPPTQHVPKGELYVLGTSIIAIVIAYPIWVLIHVKEYKSRA